MKSKLAFAAALLGAAALTLPAPAIADTGDDAFLAILTKYDVPQPGGASAAVTVAHRVCAALRRGDTPDTVMSYVFRDNGAYTMTDSAHFVGAAIGAYCPEQMPRIDNPSSEPAI